MDLLRQFQNFIKEKKLFQQADSLLVAVSGGIDSIVLCDLCKKSGFSFSIAHCNFQLRGNESNEDEIFVRALAEKYGVEFFVKKFETTTYAGEKKISIQLAAREVRYEWFKTLSQTDTAQSINYILTAHHADDNIETVMMNFFKGTGLGGLRGIQPKSGRNPEIIRPLMFAKKESLQAYSAENNLLHREDSSNITDDYSRNYFRHNIIPALRNIYPQVDDNILDNIDRMNESYLLYRQSLDLLRKKIFIEKDGEYHLPVLLLLKTAALKTFLFETGKEFGFTVLQTGEIIKLLKSSSGKYVDSPTHRILKNRDWLIISKHADPAQAHFIIEEGDREILYSHQRLQITTGSSDAKIIKSESVAQLDFKKVKFPLLLRKWKKGDYFYPLGMHKKKKLSRFFGDQKLSLIEKENTWLIESDRKIIWIVGRRIDDRFKLGPSTKKILQFTLLSPK